jgi:hypothetical protein
MSRLWRHIMPSRRPMDDMALGWQRPLEDEFALCNLGQPSPYLTFAFPNHPPQCTEYFDLEALTPAQRQQWNRAFVHFLKQLTFRQQKRLVLKSPTHTYRIRVLLELFPKARFVHIVRNPFVVLPSTIHAWRMLYQLLGLQRPDFAGLEQEVFDNYRHMFTKLEETRELIDRRHIYELRYEELVQDPVASVSAIYDSLELGHIAPVLPKLREYLAGTAGYETNRYTLSPAMSDAVSQCAEGVLRRYRYA